MESSFFKNRFSSPWFAFILIGLSVLVIYSNIYNSPFVFDDVPSIAGNKTIRTLPNYLSLCKLLEPRAIVDFTFALNYRFGKLNVCGYHLVNVLIHTLNGLLVYLLVLTILKRFPESFSLADPSIFDPPYFSIRTISLFAALIFVVHPIQTQAVTYTVQRYASMAAMFYMASVLFYLKARIIQQNAKRLKRIELEQDGTTHTFKLSSLYVLAILCGMLAFLSKQNTASLPLAILLVEFLLIDRTWQQWKRKLPWFALSFALWILFILYISGLFSGGFAGRELLEDVSGLMKETETVGRWQYLCTQFNVLAIYIKLLFLPIKQNLDYLYPFKSGFFDAYTPFAFLFLTGLLALGAWQIKKRAVIALAIFWFFITLAVESSIIPIKDALYEHRLYLPMFGFALVVAYLLFDLLIKKRFWAIIVYVFIILSLGAGTYHRNSIWQDSISLWSDVVSKSPHNPRAHHNLGFALAEQGRTEDAIKHYLQALQIKPDAEIPHYNIGLALDKLGHTKGAIKHYLEALRIKPDYTEAHNSLGNALLKQGKVGEATGRFKEALRLNPELSEAYNSLGTALTRTGKIDEAIVHFRKALQIDPGLAETHVNLGGVLFSMGRIDEAVVHLRKALKINPDIAEAHINLGVALANTGKIEDAVTHFRKALQLDPDNAEALDNLNQTMATLEEIDRKIEYIRSEQILAPDDPKLNYQLGIMYQAKGQSDTAEDYYQKAISLQSEFPEALYELAKLYVGRGEYEKALSLYHKMIAFLPDNPAGYYNIACIYARLNRPEESVAWLKKAVAKGLNDWEHIKNDKDLDNIRSSLQYKEFVKGH